MNDPELAFIVLFFAAVLGLVWWGFWYAPRLQRERDEAALRDNDHEYIFKRLWAARNRSVGMVACLIFCLPRTSAEYYRGLREARERRARGEPVAREVVAEAFGGYAARPFAPTLVA